jgi:radical SAM protein with 4Fe4S-binding SPASM domain
MYKLIVRNDKGTGQAIFYNPKKSEIYWDSFAIPLNDQKLFDIEENAAIEDFIDSIRTKRTIQELPNFNILREECMHCPVVQLCKGIDKQENWTKACNESYLKNVNNLYWSILVLTKQKLESIEGDIRRPE